MSRLLVQLLGLLLLLAGCQAETPEALSRPGRIILVSMDTVRADHVSGFGSAATTPALREIAAEGVLFRHFYAASTYTIPATMSILTGLDPAEHGVHRDSARLSPQVPTLAEALARTGYRTHAFHEGGYVDARFGFARGFDAYLERPRLSVVLSALPEVLAWIRDAGPTPYFLFLHTYAAHFPYGGFERHRRRHPERGLPTDAELRELRQRHPRGLLRAGQAPPDIPTATRAICTLYNHLARDHASMLGCGDNRLPASFPESSNFETDRDAIVSSYDERIRLIDAALGRIRETLTHLGQWDDTLLVVMSDHGEAFFEHGLQRHDFVPFNEVLEVPLVISYPRLLRKRGVRVVEGLAWHLDLMPTILGLAGLPHPGRPRGIDLTPVLLGRESIDPGRAVFPAVLRVAHRPQEPLRRVGLRRRLKYIEGHPRFGDAEGLLFDLEVDPGERRNLRPEGDARFDDFALAVRDYTSQLEIYPAFDQRTGRPIQTAPAEADSRVDLAPAKEEHLRALGYLD